MDDLKTTTHGVSDTHVELHKDMGSNMIADLKGLKAKVSKRMLFLVDEHQGGPYFDQECCQIPRSWDHIGCQAHHGND